VSLDGYDGYNALVWLAQYRWVSLWGDCNMRIYAFELTRVQFIDPKTGLCGLVAAQLIAGEAKAIKELLVQFQRGIYEMFAASKAEAENGKWEDLTIQRFGKVARTK
jgi:hypothetical protein